MDQSNPFKPTFMPHENSGSSIRPMQQVIHQAQAPISSSFTSSEPPFRRRARHFRAAESTRTLKKARAAQAEDMNGAAHVRGGLGHPVWRSGALGERWPMNGGRLYCQDSSCDVPKNDPPSPSSRRKGPLFSSLCEGATWSVKRTMLTKASPPTP